jgi:hypothetical protein
MSVYAETSKTIIPMIIWSLCLMESVGFSSLNIFPLFCHPLPAAKKKCSLFGTHVEHYQHELLNMVLVSLWILMDPCSYVCVFLLVDIIL